MNKVLLQSKEELIKFFGKKENNSWVFVITKMMYRLLLASFLVSNSITLFLIIETHLDISEITLLFVISHTIDMFIFASMIFSIMILLKAWFITVMKSENERGA